MTRDTDADWSRLAEVEPHWAVLTDPRFKADRLDAEALAVFWDSGNSQAVNTHNALKAELGAPERFASALDFGCGVGRLLAPISRLSGHAAGVDVAEAMRAHAARNLAEQGCANASVHASVAEAADAHGPFDWINSYIVLQHIPPERGMALIGQLLGALAPGGWISLHVTTGRDEHLRPRGGLRARIGKVLADVRGAAPSGPEGLVAMYDYDLGAVVAALVASGVRRTVFEPHSHGGHHGCMILGRRDL